ncbi:haloacid dehalogenase type II [Streptomyces mirabilis]|uniref:haloacid dehalogenase type II n=1 Tax=Streptomyces mirabilis TaxID=68239 RepID=UPI0022561B77|nr:haloacid dehalogenase type II [Streptomyces mirabilis]MCX4420301.1 haloacid dehalogenase type II [Streptomyces mirabilis]
MSAKRPSLLILDVNETLSDLTPLRGRFEEIGAPADLMPLWFAGILRDGFALTAAGGYADFADLARDGLRGLLTDTPHQPIHLEAAVRHVVSGFSELDVHPDVPAGVRALRAAGHRLVTMTNGSAALTDTLLDKAGVRDCFEALWDVTGPRLWKPHPRAYHYAAERSGVRPDEAMLVAVHPWDVDGAQRAGMAGAWLRRRTTTYPSSLTEPAIAVEDFIELAHAIDCA